MDKESIPTKHRVTDKHAHLVWLVRNATEDLDRNRAAVLVQQELERQRTLLRKALSRLVKQQEVIDDQRELLDEQGVYFDEDGDDDDQS